MTKTLPILLLAATCLIPLSWGDAAPPGRVLSGSDDLAAGTPIRLAQADDAAAAPGKEDAPGPQTATGATALKKARELLAAHHSIRANIVETFEIDQHGFKATGRYLQRGDRKMRLEFDLQIGQTGGSLMEVCDGEILYTRHIVGEEQHLTRRNVREILEAAQQSEAAPAELFIAEMGLGGLPGLLSALEQSMTFDVLKDDTLDDKSVWMIQGTWNQQLRDRWKQPPAQKPEGDEEPADEEKAAAAELPALIPDMVRIYLDRETGFPLKIQYLKKPAGRKYARPMLTLAFRDIELNGAIDDSEFTFIPPKSPIPTDLTPIYKERIRAAVEASRAKAAAPAAQP